MAVVVYLDEAGDHSLEKIDPQFPVFVLTLLVCEIDVYVEQAVPLFNRLKFDYFGYEGVVIHSRDIRRAQGDFGFLTDAVARQGFYERINTIMRSVEYCLIAVAIKKRDHLSRYGVRARNPYELALTYGVERLVRLLEGRGQSSIHLIAEARGEREDDSLRAAFLKLLTDGTDFVKARRFKAIEFRLTFEPKLKNLIGHQMADLASYPIARHVLDPSRADPAYDILKEKFHPGAGQAYGLKIFP